MFGSNRSLCRKVGSNLQTKITVSGQASPSSSSASRYILFPFQNPNVFVDKSRFNSVISFCSTSNNDVRYHHTRKRKALIASYLMNSWGLSEIDAVTVAKRTKLKIKITEKINKFNTTSQMDPVVTLFKSYGFTKPHISKIIRNCPSFLYYENPLKSLKPRLDVFNSKGIHGIQLGGVISRNPDVLRLSLKDLKPVLDFLSSKGIHGIELAGVLSRNPNILSHSLKDTIIPSFDILKSIFHTDRSAIRILGRYSTSWGATVKKLMEYVVQIGSLRYEGVPQSALFGKCLTTVQEPSRFFMEKITKRVKGTRCDPLYAAFMAAIKGFFSMSDATWKSKIDVYKRWGLSEDQIQSAFRRSPWCMLVPAKKIMAVMDFLVNEMGYDSLSIAESPLIFDYNLKERIMPRCSVIRILVSKGLIEEKISLSSLSVMTDKSFLEKFVQPYEQESPELMMVFESQLSYRELLLK